MDPEKFKSRMHSLAYGNAMLAAAEDYKKEALETATARAAPITEGVNVDDLLDDPELDHLYAERLHALQKEAEKRNKLRLQGHGELQTIEEGQFLQIATEEETCVCHLFHQDFQRCRILDRHFEALARKYFNTRFVRLSAPDAPFFTVKLQVKVLPTVLLLCGGVVRDRIVGFDELGGKDDFMTATLEERLMRSGVIEAAPRRTSDSEDDIPSRECGIRPSQIEDEDSDFE